MLIRFLILLLFFTIPHRSLAFAEPTITEKAAFFNLTLTNLSERYHLGFVVEGCPHPVVLAHLRRLPELPLDDLNLSITTLATLYDYIPQRLGTVVTLRKRYTYPQEMPLVTQEEFYLMGKEIEQALSGQVALESSLGQNFVGANVREVINGFTPEQKNRLKKGECLRVDSDLSTQQKNRIRTLALLKFLRPLMSGAVELRSSLDPAIDVPFSFGGITGGIIAPKSIGYSITPVGFDKPYFFPIVSQAAPTVDSAESPDSPSRAVLKKGSDVLDRIFILLHLDAFIERINQRRSKGVGPYFVVPALAAKPVMLFGEAWMTAEKTVAAVASIYGLTVRHEKSGRTVLGRAAQPRTVDALNALPFAIRALPAPLFRALHIADRIRLVEEKNNNLRTSFDAFLVSYEKIASNRNELVREASAQLEESLSGELERTQKGSLRLSEVTPFDQSRFAVYKCKKIVDFFNENTISPLYITRFDEMCIKYTFFDEDGEKKSNLAFYLYDNATGKAGTPLFMYISRL